jgi:hypothetical protein
MTDIPDSVKDKLPGICSKKPVQRYPAIKDFTRELLRCTEVKTILDKAAITLGEDFVSVTSNAVELELPEIVLAGREDRGSIAERSTCFSRNGWGRETQRMDFKGLQQMEKYMIVTFDERDEREAKEWGNEMLSQLERARAPVKIIGLPNYQAARRGERHVDIMKRLEAENGIPVDKNGEIQIFWYCLLGTGIEEDYIDTKRYALAKGIQSQVVNLSKHKNSRNARPIMSNCTKQNINKHGSLVWWAKINPLRLPSLAGKKLLMVGFDMSHLTDEDRSRGTKAKNSMAAMVACTIDPQTSKVKTWSDNKATQQVRKSTITMSDEGDGYLTQPLAQFTADACDAIHGTSYMPEVVIVYRDGLTMNHKVEISQGEINPLQEMLKDRARVLREPPPQFVFALVNKEGRGRFFNTDRACGTAYNAPPGTAVNTSLPDAEEPTFQLIPNHETLSTAKPVTYIIMANTDLSQDDQVVDSARDRPTTSPELPALTAVRGISEVLHQSAARASASSLSPMDLGTLLKSFTADCLPHVQSGALPQHVLNKLVSGLQSVGWNAITNVPLVDQPPPVSDIRKFLDASQRVCEDEIRHLAGNQSTGSTAKERGSIPITDLQNFSFAMCFCESVSITSSSTAEPLCCCCAKFGVALPCVVWNHLPTDFPGIS